MKELIMSLNGKGEELANLIRKDNMTIEYVNINKDNAYSIKNYHECDVAFLIVDYNNLNEVELAAELLKSTVVRYLLKVITIACNTKSIKDDVYYNSKLITYTDDIVSAIETINTIISDNNLIKTNIDDILSLGRRNKEFKIIKSTSSNNFLNFEEDIKESNDCIFYVEANSLFEIYDVDTIIDMINMKHIGNNDIIFCSRMLPDKIEEINIKILAF